MAIVSHRELIKTISIFLDLPKGAKWFRYRVSIHHPLGFNWHPLEGAGILYDYIKFPNPNDYLSIELEDVSDFDLGGFHHCENGREVYLH